MIGTGGTEIVGVERQQRAPRGARCEVLPPGCIRCKKINTL